MRGDPAPQTLQSTHGRHRSPGVDGQPVLFLSDQRCCCFNLPRDDKLAKGTTVVTHPGRQAAAWEHGAAIR